jgi:hypothetical protein
LEDLLERRSDAPAVQLPNARRDITKDVGQPVSNPFAGLEAKSPSEIDDIEAELASPPDDLDVRGRDLPPRTNRRRNERVAPSESDAHRDVERRSIGYSRSKGENGQRLVIAAAVAAAIAGIVAFIVGRGGDDDEVADAGGDGIRENVAASAGGDLGMPLAVPKAGESDEEIEERIIGCLFRFFGAKDSSDLRGVVRHPERVGPLMDSYYAKNSFSMPRLLAVTHAEEGMIALKPFWEVRVALEGGEERSMALQDTPSGFRVDWEIFVHYNPVPWNEYAEDRLTGANDFRVYARLDYKPGYAFPETDGWTCVELSAHGHGDVLYGYARKESEVGKLLEEMLRDEPSKDCVLRLEFPEDPKGGDQQVWVRELISKDWIRVD